MASQSTTWRRRTAGWLIGALLLFGGASGAVLELGRIPSTPPAAFVSAGAAFGPDQVPTAAQPGAPGPAATVAVITRHASNPAAHLPASAASLPRARALTTLSRDGTAVTGLYVPYVNQLWDTDGNFDGNCACGPASLAMVLAYFGKLAARPVDMPAPYEHFSQYGWALTDASYSYGGVTFDRAVGECENGGEAFGGLYGALMVSSYSTMTEWSRMNAALETHGLSVVNYDADHVSADVVRAAVAQGHPVILTTRGLTGGGHLIVVMGYASDGRLLVNDSYGYKFDGYPNFNGANVLYNWEDFGLVRYAWEVSGTPDGWLGEYRDGAGNSFTRYDRALDFRWDAGGPGAPLDGGAFAVSWSRLLTLDEGSWTFSVSAAGDVRILVDGKPVVERPGAVAGETLAVPVALAAGQHLVQVDYRKAEGADGAIRLGLGR